MRKIILKIGCKTGRRRIVRFSGEELLCRVIYDEPGRYSRGNGETLYCVRGGYRVFAWRWSHLAGEEDKNIDELSDVLTESELLEKYTVLANDNDIFDVQELDADSV